MLQSIEIPPPPPIPSDPRDIAGNETILRSYICKLRTPPIGGSMLVQTPPSWPRYVQYFEDLISIIVDQSCIYTRNGPLHNI